MVNGFMKNYNLALFFAIATAFVSCQEKVLEIDIEPVPMTFSASIDDASSDTPETRTALSDQNAATEQQNAQWKVQWSSTDAISIFDVNLYPQKDARFDLKQSVTRDVNNGTLEVTSYDFVGSVQESQYGYYGLYPYQDCSGDDNFGLNCSSAGNDFVKLCWAGYNQNATIGSFDPDKAFLFAYTPATGNVLSFKQVFAFIKISVTFPLQAIQFRGYSDKEHKNISPLAAHTIELLMDEDGNPVIRNPKQTAHHDDGNIDLKKNTETILGTQNSTLFPGTYLVAVMPQVLEGGLEIDFKGIDSPTHVDDQKKSTTKQVTLTRGKVLDLGSFSTDDFITNGNWNGSGTAADPYQITSVAQWNLMAERVNGKQAETYRNKHYKLMNDIDCKGAILSSVGTWKNKTFEGVFDGNGRTISNYVAGRANFGSGLFGYIKNATVKNLTVKPAGILEFEDISYGWQYSPLIAESRTSGSNWVIIDNCHVLAPDSPITLPFSGEDVFCGGILGASRGNVKITNCTNAMDLTVVSNVLTARIVTEGIVGGIVGGMWLYDDDNYCIIDRCKNTGNVTLKTNGEGYAGGIIGCDIDDDLEDVTLRLTNCMNTGNVYLNHGNDQDSYFMDAYAGGIVGFHDSDGDSGNGDPYIYNCLNTGNVHACQADSFSGGILGYCYDNDTKVYNCANTGEVTAGHSPQRGSICGSEDGTYYYCHWSNDLSYMLDAKNGGTECSKMTVIDAPTMNGKLDKIPTSGYSYLSWSESGSSLTLVF